MTFHHRPKQLTTQSLPLVDVSALRGGDHFQIRKVADALGHAARDIGFFRICGHGIDPDLIEAAYAEAARFFALPEEVKQRYYIGDSPNHRGYVPFSEKGDYADEVHRNYEAFDMGLDLPRNDPDFLAGKLTLGPNVWPDLPGFKSVIARYYSEIAALGRLICGALETHLGLPQGTLTSHMSKPISQLRLLHYVRARSTKVRASVNMGAHTDYECLTLLHTRNPGLQVMTQGDEWIDVPVDHGAYVVNIGDMLEAWTNGRFRSTPHRVLNLSPERFSMPYFVAANHETEIRPFPDLLAEGESARYAPFRAGAHLERMLQRDFPYLRKRLAAQNSQATDTNAAALIGAGTEPGHTPVHNPFESRIERSPYA